MKLNIATVCTDRSNLLSVNCFSADLDKVETVNVSLDNLSDYLNNQRIELDKADCIER